MQKNWLEKNPKFCVSPGRRYQNQQILLTGKTIVKTAKSDVGKQILKNLKNQAMKSGVHSTNAAIREDDLGEAVSNKLPTVKRKAADDVQQVYGWSQKKQQHQKK